MRVDTYGRLIKNRRKIVDKILIVRADIDNQVNAIGFMDHQENVLVKYPKVYNSRRRFKFLSKNIEQVRGKKKVARSASGIETYQTLLEEVDL